MQKDKRFWLVVAKKANELWRGAFTLDEIKENAIEYYYSWRDSVETNTLVHTTREMLRNFREDMDTIGVSDEEWESEINSLTIADAERIIDEWYAENCSVTERSWEKICEVGEYSLFVDRTKKTYQWCVAWLDNGNEWRQGHYFENANEAMECFLTKTGYFKIPYARLSELATNFKDGLIQDDYDSAMEYFHDTCDMDAEECEYFGIEVDDFYR